MHEVFKKRHSTRSFKDKEIEPEKLKEILEVAHSSPSAGNLKAREIIVIKDKAIKEKLAEAAFGQDFIAEAPVVLVFFSVPSHSAQKYGERGKNLYALQDATIAASFAWLQAVMLDLSGCWVGAFKEGEVKKVLPACRQAGKLKQDWQPIAILAIGYAK